MATRYAAGTSSLDSGETKATVTMREGVQLEGLKGPHYDVLPSFTPAPGSAALPPLKVFVEPDGFVELDHTDLTSAGWDPAAVDPQTLKLRHRGTELALWVAVGEDDRFNEGDTLLFYGEALTGPYTRRNVYWLTTGGGPGLRMAQRNVEPACGYPVPACFPATAHVERDTAPSGYWQNPPGREAQDHWYWTAPLVAPTSTDLTFEMPPFDATAPSGTLRLQLAGRTDDAVNPDHHTQILLNGTPVDEAWWDGQSEFLHTATFSPTLLLAGINTLTLKSVGDTGATVDSLYANWLEVDYNALYVSQDNKLLFAAPNEGTYQFRVTGFGTADVEAFDIADPLAPVRLRHVHVHEQDDTHTLVFEDRAQVTSRYVTLTASQFRSPAGLEADRPSDLRSTASGADQIIITHDDFYTATLPLAAHREAQGLRVKIVRTTDVYDEFSGGMFTPYAVRDFLAYAHAHWAPPAPAYVLLVGDANLDYLDRFGTGSPNFVPTYVFDADEVGQTANDNWFACVDGNDPLPDLSLGRLPARSPAEVDAMVNKILSYETTSTPGDWVTRTLFVADDDMLAFEAISDGWVNQLPPHYLAHQVYAGYYPPGDPTRDIVSAINNGISLVSYIGHGNQGRWGTWSGGQLFDGSDVSQLTNADRLPFIATATCLNGFFPNPLLEHCLAEMLVGKTDGGAIGVWSPTALGSPLEHGLLFEALFDGIARAASPACGEPQGITLGALTTGAKLVGYERGASQELIETFVLFGDPALRLRVIADDRTCLYVPLMVKRNPGRYGQ
jgi:hypothetical protein